MTLHDFLKENNSIAIAFSGGVDSAYLLYAATKYKCDVTAYYVNTEFQPEFELKDARKLASELNAKLKIINISVLDNKEVTSNPVNRCYFCKKHIFNNILMHAKKDGYTIILDGTNASDEVSDRPGMKALDELSVKSPLRECGLSKNEIRRLSKEAGLFTWNKPAYACLATRIPTNTKITAEDLRITEDSENTLFKMGFTNFRVRKINDTAKLQFPEDQLSLAIEKRIEIINSLKKYYNNITLDLEAR